MIQTMIQTLGIKHKMHYNFNSVKMISLKQWFYSEDAIDLLKSGHGNGKLCRAFVVL